MVKYNFFTFQTKKEFKKIFLVYLLDSYISATEANHPTNEISSSEEE